MPGCVKVSKLTSTLHTDRGVPGQLFAVKHPKTWMRFERGEISEEEMYTDFFTDGRSFDGPAMKEQMVAPTATIKAAVELIEAAVMLLAVQAGCCQGCCQAGRIT